MPTQTHSERNILIQGARILDPSQKVDQVEDLLILDGRIYQLGKGLSAPPGTQKIDGHGLLLTPGLVDLHAHVREPGEEYKEDIASASRSAASGGFTSVCAMPNTRPTNDCRAVTELIRSRAQSVGGVRFYPIGAITLGLQGKALTEVGELKDAGAVAISDDGRPVMDSGLMRRALEYGRTFDLTVIQHAEDLNLSKGGVMHEGFCSTRAGLRGQPSQAESSLVARDLALVELTGARYHVAHISTKESVRLVRDAKRRGLPVTCEVTPHHLVLTHEACLGYNTSTKINPPLRTSEDIDVLLAALNDGTIDAIATDHAPHSSLEKQVEFDCAAFGAIGFETALALVLQLVERKAISLNQAIEKMTSSPARVLNLPGGTLKKGANADVILIDLKKAWTVSPLMILSKSQNSPFMGWKLVGKVVTTIVDGKVIYDEKH